ncbi:hypothetical protein K0U27_06500 [archaeon]|nr:hypothetical protein [archaeon]
MATSIEIYFGIFIVFGTLLAVAIVSTLINHRKKTKLSQKMCISCRGVGFMMTYTSKPVPPCRKCNGTGYVDKR